MTTFNQVLSWFSESFRFYSSTHNMPPRLVNRGGLIQLVSCGDIKHDERVLWRFSQSDLYLGLLSTVWDEITYKILLELLETKPCELKTIFQDTQRSNQSVVSPSQSSAPSLTESPSFGTKQLLPCLPIRACDSPSSAASSSQISGCSEPPSTPSKSEHQ
jgi:hypothetical protein